jgi:hypothetical protein
LWDREAPAQKHGDQTESIAGRQTPSASNLAQNFVSNAEILEKTICLAAQGTQGRDLAPRGMIAFIAE